MKQRILALAVGLGLIVPGIAQAEYINAQTGTTYTFVNSDCGKLVTFNNAASVAVTLPQAGASGLFLGGCTISVLGIGVGTVTITPTTSTINGSATQAFGQYAGGVISSDATPSATGNFWFQPGLNSAAGQTTSSITASASTLPINGLAAAQGGTVTVTGGTSSTSANAGGAVGLVGGTGGATGAGGAANVTGGIGTATGNGGAVADTGGAGGATSGTGGAYTAAAGAGGGTGSGGVASVTGGASGTGATGAGGIGKVVGGAALSTNGAGGAAQVTGGAGVGTGNGGAATIAGGVAGATGAGGAASLTGGVGGATSGTGGALTLASGAAGATTGVGGAVTVTAGASTNGAGANVTVTAAGGASGTSAGGIVNLVPGAAVSTGVPGTVQVNSNANLIYATYYFTGTAAATNQTFFIATRPMIVETCSEIHSTAAGGTSTLTVEKLHGVTAPGSGTSVQTGSFNLNATANTVQAGTITSTVATATMATGDALGVVFANAIQSSAGVTVSCGLAPL